ncbi:hypothetical protein [Micromonospora auratinigra]|uniref:Uncharacterized protein n=1 Tax=Micromonospora auratinigra TaxID=261654 RepID=A0A1A8Z403_9ACTN|nr:hypothetical protein [Micromonospora auratinigra]SBT38601.1 hypothetical protein GA0070611_0607 [Micromonospora auratinigra]
MTAPYRPGPPPGPRPGPPPAGPRPGPPAGVRPALPEEVGEARHPAVDAAVQAMINAEGLSPADQIAQYEAAYDTLRETLASIDQA